MQEAAGKRLYTLVVLAVAALAALATLAAGAPSPGSESATSGAQEESQHAYVDPANKQCRACHLRQYTTWRRTKMAHALDLLKPGERAQEKAAAGLDANKDYTADPACLECHTTGYGAPTGFRSVEETPHLAGVTCEGCHGPGADYGTDEAMGPQNREHTFEEMFALGLVYPVPEATCRECHNERSPHNESVDPKYAFDYDERVHLGTHDHEQLQYDHGPLPEGIVFQEGGR